MGLLHFELIVNVDLYAQQLQRVYDALKASYPALFNERPTLLQRDIASAHTVNVIELKFEEPDFASSDYHRAMVHFLRERIV